MPVPVRLAPATVCLCLERPIRLRETPEGTLTSHKFSSLRHQAMSMVFEPRNPAYEAHVRESFGRQAFMATLGARLLRIEPGEVEIEFAHRAELTQQHGFLHAGAVAAVLDSACGYAAFTLMPPEAGVLAVEFKINLLAPAKGARFVARGRVIRPGRTLTVCSGEVLDVSGEEAQPIATMLSTIMAVYGREDVRA